MTISESTTNSEAPTRPFQPARVHHFNYFTNDFVACREFYEDIAGLPLVGFWIESVPDTIISNLSEPVEGRTNVMGHAFFGLADGSVLAFMEFADADLHNSLVGNLPPSVAHIALDVDKDQFASVRQRLIDAGYADSMMEVDHGVARSIYVRDPNGLQVEFALEAPGAEPYFAQGPAAYEYFERYLAGDRTANSPAKG